MKFAGAYVPIEKPDKPRVRAVFDRHNGGPSDEYAEVFTAAEVRRPVNVGDPAQVYVDGAYAGLLAGVTSATPAVRAAVGPLVGPLPRK